MSEEIYCGECVYLTAIGEFTKRVEYICGHPCCGSWDVDPQGEAPDWCPKQYGG